MKDDVYTQNDLRRYNILTMDYVLNLEPGDFYAVLDLKAEARRCLRAFFTFDDGRRIMSTVHWWQRYLGLYEIPCKSRVKLHYDANIGAMYSIEGNGSMLQFLTSVKGF